MDSFPHTNPNESGSPTPSCPLPQFIFLRSEPQLKAPMAGAICEPGRGWCGGSLLVMPLSSGRFPEPDPPRPGTQGRGGVKTWRAFAWSPWACSHLLPAHTQLATFDPTKFELKRGRWLRSSSLFWRSQERREKRGGGLQRKSRGSRTRDGEKLCDDMAMYPFIENMHSPKQMCFQLKTTHCCGSGQLVFHGTVISSHHWATLN